jgi:Zn-dependent protease
MLFSLQEILDIVIMTLAVGFIFKDIFAPRRPVLNPDNYDPVAHYRGLGRKYDLGGFIFGMMVAAPAVLFHELGHKLVAISYGMSAEFHAAYFWLALGVILKLLNFGFIFFVPAYVSIIGSSTPFASAMTAFAGPAVNLALFLITFLLLKSRSFVKNNKKYVPLLFITSRINIFLFIFNMLPIPMFDGWKVYSGLIGAFF